MGCRDFCISVRGIEPLTSKREAFFERSGWKLRSRARSGRLRRGSNPLRRAKKGHPIRDGPFWHISLKVRDSNHVRTCRGHVHSPVRTLANTIIPFRVSRKRKGMQANPLRRAKIPIPRMGCRVFAYTGNSSNPRPQNTFLCNYCIALYQI